MKINYILLFFILCAMLTASCESAKDKKQNTAVNERDTSKIVPFDGPDDTPSQTEERAALIKRYDEVQIIDTTFIDRTDSLHFYLKYYCLKNDKIKVPKKYQSDEKVPYLFVTHPFASDITLIRNADTVLKKQFTANDFKPFYNDPFVGALKKYGSILMPEISRMNKDKSRVVLGYSVAIPATDLGLGFELIISKDGTYKISGN